MSDWVDSTNPNGAAAGDAPPTKLSLNDLESAHSGVANVEEVSILGEGDGQGDPYIDSTWEQTESNVPRAGVPSLLPSRMIQATPTEAMSYSEASHSGPSYTVPTESVPHASNPHLEELIQGLIDDPMPYPSLYWIPEFSWQDLHLCFDGQPLELQATRDDQFSRGGPGSEHGLLLSQWRAPHKGELDHEHEGFQISAVVGVGKFVNPDGRWDENNRPEKLEVASAMGSVSTDISLSENTFKGEFIEAGLPAHVEIALQKTVNNIVETIIDDYCRSYAPQKRSLAAKRKLVDQSSSTSTKSSRATATRKGANRGGRKGQTIDGNGESEDEESCGDRHSPSGTDTSAEQIRFLACPFMKWNPREHRNSCIKKIRDMYGLKKHIQEKHFVIHCPKCFMTPPQDAKVIPPHPCIETLGLLARPPPVGLITMDMQTAIRERPGTRLSQKERWERLFKIIFPLEPIPSNPYLDHETALCLCAYDNFVSLPSVKHRLRDLIKEAQLEGLWRRVDELVLERLAVRFLDVLRADVLGMNACMASDPVPVNHAQSISSMESGIPDYSYIIDSRGLGSDQDQTTAFQSGVLAGVDNTTTPIPTPFVNHPDIGVGEIFDCLETTDTYGGFHSDVAGNANFEDAGSDPFSRPGAGDTLWYGRQETFEADFGQIRDDQTIIQDFSL
ncbi:hypothetical protein FMEXI_5300 [Fusarium mexicanum]|uniref:Uncharacterized protein n=1 Tax=Fusarium mexicanum TaxID=751941 RepID=A0A8H5J1F9_9HYPO|nr:hypothetical protein FMEXI_5300 [Fusarium mexicanum]